MLFVLVFLLLDGTLAQTTKPNILVIIADDLGWANVQYHNDNGEVKTPNLDFLVKNGLELNRQYAHYVCSPTRSSFQSGRLPVHNNLSNVPARQNVYNGVPPNYTCIAERLSKDGGYATHFVGKWDCGSTVIEQTPFGRGYDTAFGYLNHMNDYWMEGNGDCTIDGEMVNIIDLWENDKPAVGYNNTGMYEELLFAQKVLDNIENAAKNKDQPFFMVYAAHIGHSPIQVPAEYLNTFTNDDNLCQNYVFNNRSHNPVYPGFNISSDNWHCRSIYQSMINFLDEIIGNITSALKKNDLWDNTLIVFTADNGGMLWLNETGANNTPLRGSKTTPFEGGVRVAAAISGGYLPEHRRGQKEEAMIHIADYYATFLYLAGDIDPTDERAQKAGLLPIDSMNIWPLISGENTTSPRTEVPIDDHTLISGKYKFINGTMPNYASWTGTFWPNSSVYDHPVRGTKLDCLNNGGCLFDLEADMTEHINIIDDNMDIATKLNERLEELKKGYYTNNEKGIEKCPKNINISCQCWTALNIYGGFWGPSEYLPNSTMDTYPNYDQAA